MAGLGPPPPEKINYRSMGRGDGGVGRKPRPRYYWDPDNPTMASIPSTYETKLYRDNRERKGFSSAATRFELRPSAKLPGPGSYRNEAVDAVRANPEGCVGKRGNGPFASRRPRMENIKGAADVGPGDYNTQEEAIGRRGHETCSAAFAQPASSNPELWAARPAPGPGDYLGPDHAVSARGPLRSAHVTIPRDAYGERAAAPRSARGADGEATKERPLVEASGSPALPPRPRSKQRAAQAPATGAAPHGAAGSNRLMYESAVGLCTQLSEAEAAKAAGGAPAAPWGGSAPARPPPPSAARPETFATAKRQIFEKLKSAGWERPVGGSAVPGPADYQPNIDVVIGQQHFSTFGSGAFQLGNSDKPRTRRTASPGPGDYDSAVVPPAHSPKRPHGGVIAKAPRWASEVGVAPGPAYYSPRTKEPQQSFHLNTSSHWV
mmetsp:Transcript_89227/g.257286  ORF Transcript_89227/g.257286 Transcript_89227/m.257286 type:complete len:435 (-) Transcript_89227:115-1419(-)